MFDRRLIEYFDWGLLSITLALSAIGLGILYSAETAGGLTPQKILFGKQMVWLCIGFVVMTVIFLFDYKLLDRWGGIFYLLCIALLIGVLIFGKYVAGSRRWLVFGPVALQPSELVKVAVIIMLARYYSKNANVGGFTLRELVIPVIIVLIPFALIVKQPDLGTAMIIVLISASMTLFAKIEKRSLITIILGCLLTALPVWMFLLKEYQKQRIRTFFNPDLDPFGAGYHIIQSKIAIGSGMILGKGFLKGTQKALSFLPEQHTDFILSVLAEEWGFVGAGLLLLIYLLLIFWGLSIAQRCRNSFGTILSVGISAMLFWQIFINTGMVMGLMPVVGVPLPLISYGGSSVVTSMIGMGILMSISMRRFILD